MSKAKTAAEKKAAEKKAAEKKAAAAAKAAENKFFNSMKKAYSFEALQSSVQDVRNISTAAAADYSSNFFNLFCTTEYLDVASCKSFANYNAKNNKCIICNVADICKHTKLNANNEVITAEYKNKAVRTECKQSMLDKIIITLFQSADTKLKKEQIAAIAAEYNKTISAVKSKVSSFRCVLTKLKDKDLTANEDSKLTTKIAAYMLSNYNVKQFKLTKNDKASLKYFNDTLDCLIKNKLVKADNFKRLQ